MRELVRIAPLLLLGILPLTARPVTVIPVSQSTVTVVGSGLNGETFNLTKAYGDWYSTPKAAHASLTLVTGAGATRVQLGLEWDGLSMTQSITSGPERVNAAATFDLNLEGTGAHQQDIRPVSGDAITVTITKMDEQSLEATFEGLATGAGPVRVSGVIKLHRAATAAGTVSGTFGDCDPHIYDKLTGAEWRSPSECEVKFDSYVLAGLAPVFAPVESQLLSAGWTETKKPRMDPIDSIPRKSEKQPFQLVNRGGGAFTYTFALGQNSAEYQRLNQAAMDAMQKAMGQVLKGGPAGPAGSMDAATEATRALAEGTSLDVSFAINLASSGITDFKGGHMVKPLPGGGFAIEVPYAQPATGGGPDGAVRETYVFVGAWGAPPASTTSSGDETISVKGALNPAKLLAVQNVRIRIQGGAEQTQKVMQAMDWNALRALIAK